MKASQFKVDDAQNRSEGINAAVAALKEHKTIVIPTDTVYGIAADAFSPEAVTNLLADKGRSRTMPPPVLIFDQAVLAGLADEVSEDAKKLAAEFWPGALTLIFYSQPSLQWDLGETQGTVALRVPNDEVTLDLLRQTGPLAVSSANKTGRPAATTAEEAAQQLGEDVEVILDGGVRPLEGKESQPSTIVDCTSDRFVVVREGAISVEELRQVVPSVVTRAELEEEEKQSRLAAVETETAEPQATTDKSVGVQPWEQASVGQSQQLDSRLVEEGGIALARSLVTAAPAGTKADQLRFAKKTPRFEDTTTVPFSVSQARALVNGTLTQQSAELEAEQSSALTVEEPATGELKEEVQTSAPAKFSSVQEGNPTKEISPVNLTGSAALADADEVENALAPWTRSQAIISPVQAEARTSSSETDKP